jgi:hypothetical protein
VGEGIDDLRPFSAEEFVDALLPADEDDSVLRHGAHGSGA